MWLCFAVSNNMQTIPVVTIGDVQETVSMFVTHYNG